MLNAQLTVTERHAVLFAIEQGLMPKKTGKKFEWEIAVATENRLAVLIQDYDWADEVLHARIGRNWLIPELGSQQKAMAVGDEAWSRVLVDWGKWKKNGLTMHRNCGLRFIARLVATGEPTPTLTYCNTVLATRMRELISRKFLPRSRRRPGKPKLECSAH
jgi:hypothetical protein